MVPLGQMLLDMLMRLDTDSSGHITEEEWVKGGCDAVPLLVLLGVDQSAFNIQKVTEGVHVWKHTKKTSTKLCFKPSCAKEIRKNYFKCDGMVWCDSDVSRVL